MNCLWWVAQRGFHRSLQSNFHTEFPEKGAARWATPIAELDNLGLDNYQNFMQRFRSCFHNSMFEIMKFADSGKRISKRMLDLKLLDMGWNELVLTDQFKEGLPE